MQQKESCSWRPICVGRNACSMQIYHGCRFTHFEGGCIYITALGWHALSEGTYMSARTHVAWKYSMAVSSHALSGGAYITASTHVASRYIMALGWHTLSEGTYVSQNACSVKIYHSSRLARFERRHIY